MRLRTFFGALALSAALFCTAAVTESSAQAPTAVVGAAAPSRANLYVYPNQFPCVPGPGFCRRIIIIIIIDAASVCSPTHDYRATGNVQMAVNKTEEVAWIADVTGADIPESMVLQKGETAIATKTLEPPPAGLD